MEFRRNDTPSVLSRELTAAQERELEQEHSIALSKGLLTGQIAAHVSTNEPKPDDEDLLAKAIHAVESGTAVVVVGGRRDFSDGSARPLQLTRPTERLLHSARLVNQARRLVRADQWSQVRMLLDPVPFGAVSEIARKEIDFIKMQAADKAIVEELHGAVSNN